MIDNIFSYIDYFFFLHILNKFYFIDVASALVEENLKSRRVVQVKCQYSYISYPFNFKI